MWRIATPRGFQKEARAPSVTSNLFQKIKWSILHLLNLLLGLVKYMHNMTLISYLWLFVEREKFRFITHSRTMEKVDGFIISAPTTDDLRISCLEHLKVPYVVCLRSSASGLSKHFSWVDVDNEWVFFQVTEYLISLGHKNITLLNSYEELNFAFDRRLGFEKHLKKTASFKCRPGFIQPDIWTGRFSLSHWTCPIEWTLFCRIIFFLSYCAWCIARNSANGP